MEMTHFVASVVRAPTTPSFQPRVSPRGGGGEARPGPLGCRHVDTIPGEFDYEEGSFRSEQVGHFVQGASDVLHVVQRQDRHDMVERSGLGELLYPDAAEDWALGSPGIDGDDGVAGAVEDDCQLSVPASHLQHPGWRVTDLIQDKPLDAPLPGSVLTHATAGCHGASAGLPLTVCGHSCIQDSHCISSVSRRFRANRMTLLSNLQHRVGGYTIRWTRTRRPGV